MPSVPKYFLVMPCVLLRWRAVIFLCRLRVYACSGDAHRELGSHSRTPHDKRYSWVRVEVNRGWRRFLVGDLQQPIEHRFLLILVEAEGTRPVLHGFCCA
jgi:hypothetical protein